MDREIRILTSHKYNEKIIKLPTKSYCFCKFN
jgi:hypothetical protein